VSRLADYFHTDWAAMTTNDWIGTVITVVAFFLMVGLYVYVLRPKNREKYESRRFIPLEDEDRQVIGDKNGGT
jgi:cytochrome c oxidase cbb3-type subunit IV